MKFTDSPAQPEGRPLSECLAQNRNKKGMERLRLILSQTPFPHYEPLLGKAKRFMRIEANGKKTIGRFIDRVFIAE